MSCSRYNPSSLHVVHSVFVCEPCFWHPGDSWASNVTCLRDVWWIQYGVFLVFRKITSGLGHNYMDTNERPVTWANGLDVVVVVRILERVQGVIWSMEKSTEYVIFQIHPIVVQGIFTICVSVFNSTGNYPNFLHMRCRATGRLGTSDVYIRPDSYWIRPDSYWIRHDDCDVCKQYRDDDCFVDWTVMWSSQWQLWPVQYGHARIHST
jgi:hypothetical protein